jgi:hypothetical protein
MAVIKAPPKVLPIIGIIFVENVSVDDALKTLKREIGDVILKSDTIPFSHTDYYTNEMGNGLSREWRVFDKLIEPNILVHLKHTTNDIERAYLNEKGGRTINIDPGLLSLSNLILASTKNYSHRIYLSNGIYAEVTLIFKNSRFNPLEWTYPDYRENTALDFFSEARKLLKDRLIKEEKCLNYQ